MSFLERFDQQRIMVFGDIITDIYEFGTIRRLSREAPVPIIEHDSERVVPGGAGNVIANLLSLRGQVYPVSVLGRDEPGDLMRKCLMDLGLEMEGVIRSVDLSTTTKRRILAQGLHTVRQQLFRLDRLPTKSLSESELADLWNAFNRYLFHVQAVVISDYDLPVIPGPFFTQIASAAEAAGKLVIVDSRHRLLDFKETTLLTPNRVEAEEAVGGFLGSPDELRRAGHYIMERTGTRLLVITLGEDGMAFFERGKDMQLIPAANRLEVFDVSGAGDTVVAAATLGLLSGLTPYKAALFANVAAGLVVRKMGTATVTQDEIIEHLRQHKSGVDVFAGSRLSL